MTGNHNESIIGRTNAILATDFRNRLRTYTVFSLPHSFVVLADLLLNFLRLFEQKFPLGDIIVGLIVEVPQFSCK